MQFKLFLAGSILLVLGVSAYAMIPNVHTSTVLQTLPLPPPGPLQIPAGGILELPENLSVASAHENMLLVNLTVLSTPGQRLSSVLFQVFQKNQTSSCPETTKRSFIVNQEVSNETLRGSIYQSGLYCFVFDNEGSTAAKTVTLSTSISSTFQQIQVANDGDMNTVGIIVGILGFLILVAGILKKTVIPWE